MPRKIFFEALWTWSRLRVLAAKRSAAKPRARKKFFGPYAGHHEQLRQLRNGIWQLAAAQLRQLRNGIWQLATAARQRATGNGQRQRATGLLGATFSDYVFGPFVGQKALTATGNGDPGVPVEMALRLCRTPYSQAHVWGIIHLFNRSAQTAGPTLWACDPWVKLQTSRYLKSFS